MLEKICYTIGFIQGRINRAFHMIRNMIAFFLFHVLSIDFIFKGLARCLAFKYKAQDFLSLMKAKYFSRMTLFVVLDITFMKGVIAGKEVYYPEFTLRKVLGQELIEKIKRDAPYHRPSFLALGDYYNDDRVSFIKARGGRQLSTGISLERGTKHIAILPLDPDNKFDIDANTLSSEETAKKVADALTNFLEVELPGEYGTAMRRAFTAYGPYEW